MSQSSITMFEKGQTAGVSAATDLVQYEGQRKSFWSKTYNQWVECLCVRNVATVALQPKRLVTFKAGYFGRRVDGYAETLNDGPCGVVDDDISGTVAVNDLFWLIIGGPALIKTDFAAVSDFSANGPVTAQTAANSTAAGTTGVAGRITAAAPANATDATGAAALISGVIGYAMTARTTNNTNTDTLVYVAPRRF